MAKAATTSREVDPLLVESVVPASGDRYRRFVERITGFAYSEPESEDAWRRILDFFDEHLSAG